MSLTPSLVYDVTLPQSFYDIEKIWIDEIAVYSTQKPVILLVANKIDKEGRVITTEMGQDLAKRKGMLYHECSSKTGDGVDEVFMQCALEVSNFAHSA